MAAPPDLRRKVLDASIQLIERDGLAALSLREVARRAGVSHQAPYHHFGDRESILAALVKEGFDELSRRIDASAEGLTLPTEKIAACGAAYVEFALAWPAHFQVMFRPELVDQRRFPETHAAAGAAFGKLQAAVAELGGDAKLLTSLCWSTVHGLASLMLDGSLLKKSASAAERKAHVRAVTSTLASMLKPPKQRKRS